MKSVRFEKWINLQATGSSASSGKPRRFEIDAYDGGPLPVEGFEYPVIVDLESLEHPESMPLLIDHEGSVEATLGCTDSINNSGQGIRISGPVTATSPKALNVVRQSDKGQRWQASIGVRPSIHAEHLQRVRAGQPIAINGQTFTGPVMVLRHGQMYETSVLPAGADQTTRVNLAAKAARLLKGSSMLTFEEFIADGSFDMATLTEDQRAYMTLLYDAQISPLPPVVTPPIVSDDTATTVTATGLDPEVVETAKEETKQEMLASIRKTQTEELQRISDINDVAEKHPKILRAAISGGWDAIKTENAVLKEDAKIQAPISRGGSKTSVEATPLVLEAAVCMTRKLPGHEKQFDDQTLQAAHTTFGRAGIGLQQLLLVAASANGYSLNAGERVGNGNLRNVLKAAFGHGVSAVQAAFSTVSLPGIFSNLANKELLAGYEADEQLMLWKLIADIKSVSDFKSVTSYRMLDSLEYEKLGAGGKIKHGTTGEESYSRSAETYAKMSSLTRVDIINDDLGALDDLRKRLGMGAAQKLSNVFWQAFLNAALFTSARGNYIEGSTTNLGTDGVGLQLGVNQFKTLRTSDADGSKRVGGSPKLLLVPTELSVTAEKFHKNQNFGGGTTVEEANIHAKKYEPVEVPWLSDTEFTNASSTAWYLLRDPAMYAAMVVSFLDGIEQPTVESAEADFDQLGVDFRGYHDFGCDQAEYVSGIKSKGAA